MSDTLTLAYSLQFKGEHYAVGDLIKITTCDRILIGRLDRLTAHFVMLDCSEQYSSKMVSVPLASITEVSKDFTTLAPATPTSPVG